MQDRCFSATALGLFAIRNRTAVESRRVRISRRAWEVGASYGLATIVRCIHILMTILILIYLEPLTKLCHSSP